MDQTKHRWAGLSKDERAQLDRYEACYEAGQSPVMRAIEKRVCGCDFGADSWTTRTEADDIAKLLELGPDKSFLDLGAGSGWPGLYLAKTYDCETILLDLPLGGLRIAAQRAAQDNIADKVETIVGDAAALPFTANSFDAISHSDLLCCLKQKRAVLATCREVIKPGGHMVFTVISVAPGLSTQNRARALKSGPEFIDADMDYADMLADTGWIVTRRKDVTRDFTSSCERQIEADSAHEEQLASLLGEAEFAQRVTGWHEKLTALNEHLLRRELFVAIPNSE